MHPHVLKKILSESLEEAFSKEAVCFLFCCVCLVFSPIESESMESHMILGNKIWALSSEKPE